MQRMRVSMEGTDARIVTPDGDVRVHAGELRAAAAHVVRAALASGRTEDACVGALTVSRAADGVTLRLPGSSRPFPVSVTDAAAWMRVLGDAPIAWHVNGAHVALHACGVPVWHAGPQTAATFGMALALTLEHPGVFFGMGAPFTGAARTALLPDARAGGKAVRVATYTPRRYALTVQDAGRVALTGRAYARLQRQLLGVLRAVALEQPDAVPAIRTFEALLPPATD